MDGDSSVGQLRSVYTTGGLFFIAVALSHSRVPVSNSNIPIGSPHWTWMESFLCTVVALSVARRHGFASQEKSHSRFQHRNPWKAFKSQSPTRSSGKAGYLSICLLVRKTVKSPPPTSCLDEALPPFKLPYHSHASGPFLWPHCWSLGPWDEKKSPECQGKKMRLFIQKLIFF